MFCPSLSSVDGFPRSHILFNHVSPFLFATLHRSHTPYQPRHPGILKLGNSRRTCKRLLNICFLCLLSFLTTTAR
ncbi:hypothetical protein LI328DRAFT_49572 [Trichoderma asperelloides]|nr:hypothetical protein LI328DRAFT_49572 [Trichoderma asperelloides]